MYSLYIQLTKDLLTYKDFSKYNRQSGDWARCDQLIELDGWIFLESLDYADDGEKHFFYSYGNKFSMAIF